MKIQEPFHDGEIKIQELIDERGAAIMNSGLIEDAVIIRAHKFLSQQYFLIVSTAESNEILPTTILYGDKGFAIVSPDGKKLFVSLKSHSNQSQDPVLRRLKLTSKIGCLAIELATRKRLRINGIVASITSESLEIDVYESYPNCPKYIQKRTVEFGEKKDDQEQELHQGVKLESQHLDLIKRADTFFVSSLNPNGHADTSHRGGPPGFVKVWSDDTLRIPDYAGNSLYNTLGNFHVNPFAGLIFWDFESLNFLHLYGIVEMELKADDTNDETTGTGRFWKFQVRSWEFQKVNMPYGLKFHNFSRFNPKVKIERLL